jgi:hypothetical protein
MGKWTWRDTYQKTPCKWPINTSENLCPHPETLGKGRANPQRDPGTVKGKWRWTLVKVARADFNHNKYCMGESSQNWTQFLVTQRKKAFLKEKGGWVNLSRLREVKNGKGHTRANVIRPAVTVRWQLPKLGFYPSLKTDWKIH